MNRGCSFEPPSSFRKGRHHKDPYTNAWHKRLARFMPGAFSRISLDVTGIRVERLQEISAFDALAEGCPYHVKCDPTPEDVLKWYSDLWESINGEGSWAANPFVWVVEFKREGAAN